VGPGGNTLSTLGDSTADAAPVTSPFLVVALNCERPGDDPVRLALQDVDEVVIGRGPRQQVRRELAAGQLIRHVRIADDWLSSEHARLVGQRGAWSIRDCGSKNGTRVNGEPIEETTLEDGDVIGVGHTLLVFQHDTQTTFEPVTTASDLRPPRPELGTFHDGLARAIEQLTHLVDSRVSVLVRGETGTGKELVARAIHGLSGRSGDLVAVNCGALPATLVEGQLFGHRKGAFSGASEDRIGTIRSADLGTLFLDEIGDLAPESQAAFLRVLQEGEVTPVGGTRPVSVDVRIVAATHRDLEGMIKRGEFREDLFSRINGFSLTLPPLRERLVDLGLLIQQLLPRVTDRTSVRFTSAAGYRLFAYDWPRNIRELQKFLETAIALATDGLVKLEHLPASLREDATETPAPSQPLAPARPLSAGEQTRKAELEALLHEHNGNVSAIARVKQTSRTQIQRWLKRFGLDASDYRT